MNPTSGVSIITNSSPTGSLTVAVPPTLNSLSYFPSGRTRSAFTWRTWASPSLAMSCTAQTQRDGPLTVVTIVLLQLRGERSLLPSRHHHHSIGSGCREMALAAMQTTIALSFCPLFLWAPAVGAPPPPIVVGVAATTLGLNSLHTAATTVNHRWEAEGAPPSPPARPLSTPPPLPPGHGRCCTPVASPFYSPCGTSTPW